MDCRWCVVGVCSKLRGAGAPTGSIDKGLEDALDDDRDSEHDDGRRKKGKPCDQGHSQVRSSDCQPPVTATGVPCHPYYALLTEYRLL